jgi:hypothetical protein
MIYVKDKKIRLSDFFNEEKVYRHRFSIFDELSSPLPFHYSDYTQFKKDWISDNYFKLAKESYEKCIRVVKKYKPERKWLESWLEVVF